MGDAVEKFRAIRTAERTAKVLATMVELKKQGKDDAVWKLAESYTKAMPVLDAFEIALVDLGYW